eukprot:3933410-Rhodomonas_salina.2
MAAFAPAPAARGMQPPVFPPPVAAPAPAQHVYHYKLSKAPILTDDLTQFILWQESFFRLRIKSVNQHTTWTLIINNAIHHQHLVFLGHAAV